MTGISGKNAPRTLINWACVPLPEHLETDSDQWAGILEKSLPRLASPARKIDVWCAIDPSDLKIKHITIPDMPTEKIGNAAFWGLKRETDFDETTDIFDFEILEDQEVDGIKKKNLVVFSGDGNRIQVLKKMFDRAGMLLARSLRTGILNLIEELDENPEMARLFLPGDEPETPPSVSPQVQEVSERLVSKIIRTGDYCAQHYTGNTPITHYYFLGENDTLTSFISLAQRMIPGGIRTFEPVLDAVSCQDQPTFPDKADERSAILVALGIALSDHDLTPNFIQTHQDKIQQRHRKRILGMVCLAGVMILSALVALNLFYTTAHKTDLALQDRLDQEIARLDNDITPTSIDRIVAESKKRVNQADTYIDRYRPLAVIFDLCRITPPHIRLTSLAYGNAGAKKEGARTVRIQGHITGPGLTLEAELAHYILALSSSPVFGNIQVTKEQVEVKNTLDQLLFSATLEVF